MTHVLGMVAFLQGLWPKKHKIAMIFAMMSYKQLTVYGLRLQTHQPTMWYKEEQLKGLPGKKPLVTSDILLDSPFKLKGPLEKGRN